MKKLVALTAALALSAGLAAAAAKAKSEWTGYITDTHCASKGATAKHTAGCIEKCMKAGSKAQIWDEADKKAYDLDDFAKVKDLVGSRVTVKGALDPATHTIKVESAAKAKS